PVRPTWWWCRRARWPRCAGTTGRSRRRSTGWPPRSPCRPWPTLRMDEGKLFAARLVAARARPYLAAALYALCPVASGRVPTMAVDRYWRCYVSPAFVAATPVAELAGVWVHEVSHLLRD